jgi:hypothetical protein
MSKIDFETALKQDQKNTDQDSLDETFGEGNDVIAVVGVAYIEGQAIAFARMITPGEVLPFGKTIETKRDRNHIMFLSNNLLLMATDWGETVDEFVAAGAASGFFMFEAVMPDKYQRALVSIDGEVKAVIVREITPDEYEKYLAGFYHNGDKTYARMDVNKTMEC